MSEQRLRQSSTKFSIITTSDIDDDGSIEFDEDGDEEQDIVFDLDQPRGRGGAAAGMPG